MIDSVVKDIKNQIFNSFDQINEGVNYFRNISRKGISNLNDRELEGLKTEFVKFLNLITTFYADIYPTNLFRVTINKSLYNQNVRLQKISDLIGPPKGKANYGRCNLKGESVFYAALNKSTAIWETQPQAGDLITISEWSIKEHEKLNAHFVFHPFYTNLDSNMQNAYNAWIKSKEQINPHFAEISELLMEFLADEYMKKVKNGHNQDYLFSASYSSRLIQSKPDTNGFKIDAICYPSVKMECKLTNLAIRNDCVLKKLDLKKITMYEVTKTNYKEENLINSDFIYFSPLIIETDRFDYQNDKIIYDTKAEMEMIMDLVRKQYSD